jgi:hypothetical protein
MMGFIEPLDRIVIRAGLYPAPAPRGSHLRRLSIVALLMSAIGFAIDPDEQD